MKTEEELEALSSNVIKGFLKDMGQKMSGTKKDMIARVLAWQAVPENEVRNVTKHSKNEPPKESPQSIFFIATTSTPWISQMATITASADLTM